MTKNTVLSINSISCYGYHGCLPEESVIGGRYQVDVEIEKDFSKSMASDTLSDTVDYGLVTRIVLEQMAIPSKLIEHVCARILKALYGAIGGSVRLKVTVTKFTPPVNAPVGAAVFTAEAAYNE
jgi:dihydroneopterin aldolase